MFNKAWIYILNLPGRSPKSLFRDGLADNRDIEIECISLS